MKQLFITLMLCTATFFVKAQTIAPNLGIEFEDTTVSIVWKMDNYQIDTIQTSFKNFIRVSSPDLSYCFLSDSVGLPELPYLPFTFEVPHGFEGIRDNEINVTVEFDTIYGSDCYFPHQSFANDEIDYNYDFYANTNANAHSICESDFFQISKPFEIDTFTGLRFTIKPVLHDPYTRTTIVVRSISLKWTLNESEFHNRIYSRYHLTQCPFDFSLGGGGAIVYEPQRLIVLCAPKCVLELDEYVRYRRSQGVVVNVYTTEDVLDYTKEAVLTSQGIRNFLSSLNYRPFVPWLLLVGDENVIPYTNLTYDQSTRITSDFLYTHVTDTVVSKDLALPHFYVGRWPVDVDHSREQINRMVYKIKQYESISYTIPDTSINISVFGGVNDVYPILSLPDHILFSSAVKLKKVLDVLPCNNKLFFPRHVSNQQETVGTEMLNNMQILHYLGANSPSFLYPWQMQPNTEYHLIPPIALLFGQAQDTTTTPYNYNYRWLFSDSLSGGSAYFASTINTNEVFNSNLSTVMYKTLKRTRNRMKITLGELVYESYGRYYIKDSTNTVINPYISSFILWGDPIMYLFGADDIRNSNIRGNNTLLNNTYRLSDFVVGNDIVNTLNHPIDITMCDILGRLIFSRQLSPGETLNIDQYRSQVLILQVTANNKVILTSKLLTR